MYTTHFFIKNNLLSINIKYIYLQIIHVYHIEYLQRKINKLNTHLTDHIQDLSYIQFYAYTFTLHNKQYICANYWLKQKPVISKLNIDGTKLVFIF